MKIVFTAEHAGDLSAFHQLGELLVEGWALGKPKLSAGQLIELAHDAEVLVTSYDEVTDAVMAADQKGVQGARIGIFHSGMLG